MKEFLQKHGLPRPRRSLFREAVRQLMIGGIVYAALSLILTLVGLVQSFSNLYEPWDPPVIRHILVDTPHDYFYNVVNYGTLLSVAFVVLACFYATSYLRSVSSRDYYASTPHTVGTVWLNFAAAVFVWNLLGIAVSLPITMMFLLPQALNAIGCCLLVTFHRLAISTLAFGLTMLAISLTGRLVNAIITLAGMGVFLNTVREMITLPYARRTYVLDDYNNGFTTVSSFLVKAIIALPDPIGDLYRSTKYGGEYCLDWRIWDEGVWGQAWLMLAAGLVMTALAAFIVNRRRGDEAGQPFVSRAAHAVGLLSLTFPATAFGLGTLYRLCVSFDEWGDASVDFRFWLGMEDFSYDDRWFIPVSLLVFAASFWLAELVFTLDVRHAHRGYLALPAALLMVGGLLGAGHGLSHADYLRRPSADEVVSFSLSSYEYDHYNLKYFWNGSAFFDWIDEETPFYDREIIEYCTYQIGYVLDNGGSYPIIEEYQLTPEQEEKYEYWGQEHASLRLGGVDVTLHLKDGHSMTRTVIFDRAHLEALEQLLAGDEAVMNRCVGLPASDSANIVINHSLLAPEFSKEETQEIYDCLTKEYNAKSNAEKYDFLKRYAVSMENYDGAENYDFFLNTDKSYDPYDFEPYFVYDMVSDSDTGYREKDFVAGEQSREPGRFEWSISTYNSDESEYFITLSVSGYRKGHLYQNDNSYAVSIYITPESLPETFALVTRSYENDRDKLADRLSEPSDPKDNRYLDLDVIYVDPSGTDNTAWEIDYERLTPELFKARYGSADDDPPYYDDKDYKWEEYARETDEATGTEIISRYGENAPERDIYFYEINPEDGLAALAEALRNPEPLDLTKPYCVIYVHDFNNYMDWYRERNGKGKNYKVYCNCASPLDGLNPYRILKLDPFPLVEEKDDSYIEDEVYDEDEDYIEDEPAA